ncbi:MAG TPA: endonuclease/exonuclease/phosphatase family protein [Pyrinomonadaceae bacterium]|nr:endonuclease/exonuclease/phosphatase family protein [Pyrinomonadaceae bacterium]
MSWNIAFGKGTDNVTDYNRIATWLARMSPDVIALCEIPPDQVSTVQNLLSQKTGRVWNSHFVPKSPGTPEGNLILSTYSFTTLNSRYLSYNRSIAQATINVGGRNINFFATHLDHTSSALRLTQAVELIDWTSSFASPRIVAGDLNAGNDTPEILRLLTSFRDSWVDALSANSAFAYPDNPVWLNTRTRRWRIDFVLYSADTSTFIARRGEIPDSRDLSNTNVVNRLGTPDDKGVRPSDHNIVVTDFEVLTTSAPPPPPPAAPVLLTQGTSDRAIAMHSTLFTDEPFLVRSPVNLGSDPRTRIMLFATNLDLLAGETTSSVSVRARDSRGINYDLPVEQVNKVPNFTWLSEVVVKLPDDTTITGDLVVTVGLRGAVSNAARVGIRQ